MTVETEPTQEQIDRSIQQGDDLLALWSGLTQYLAYCGWEPEELAQIALEHARKGNEPDGGTA